MYFALSLVSLAGASPQAPEADPTRNISLAVPAGAPLRLYLTKRISKRSGAPVEAKLLTPVYAFDHEVIPAGTPVLGHVSRVQPVPRWQRIRAVLGGDFTPLRVAEVEFTSVVPADGHPIALDTVETTGLSSLVPLKAAKQRSQNVPGANGPPGNGGIASAAKQKARDAIDAQTARIRSIPDIVRAPGKKEWLYDYAMSRLPYHPQYVRARTRFDAELRSPLDFGSENVPGNFLTLLGSQPSPGSIVHARLLTPLDSMSTKQGERVEAVLEEPLYSAGQTLDKKVVLPAGTIVDGSVSMAKPAGWFHRGGKLRFDFQNVELTPQTADLMTKPAVAASQSPETQSHETLQFRTQATLDAAENGTVPLKVDKEGGVQAAESKTRFIGTALALIIASRAADNDSIHGPGGTITGQRPNVGGRTLGGGIGFGLLGSIAAQSSRTVGAAFGYYGLAWSVYSTLIARGAEVQFGKNAVLDIGFNQRALGADQRAPAGNVK
jgi:hypothetical protein